MSRRIRAVLRWPLEKLNRWAAGEPPRKRQQASVTIYGAPPARPKRRKLAADCECGPLTALGCERACVRKNSAR